MGALKNAKHEAFAFGLSKGLSQADAYIQAGYAGDVGAACRLSKNVKVSARVAEIQARTAARAEISVASITERLLAIAAKGEDQNNPAMLAVARASLMDAAKLNGLVIEKASLDAKVDATHRIERAIVDPSH